MSARKLQNSEIFDSFPLEPQITRLELPSSAVRICKNGIEFQTNSPIPTWTEMTLVLEAPGESRKLHCTGVIVACSGNHLSGYNVSMLFTNLSKSAEARIGSLA